MKTSYTVLLFIGAISATQLNTLKRHHKSKRGNGNNNWDANTNANHDKYANATQYQADTPAGYGDGTAPHKNTEFGKSLMQTRHHARRHHARSNQDKLFMAMKGSTLGAFDVTDTADYYREMQQQYSSDKYVEDTPEAYGWVTADLQTGADNMQRTKPEDWGNLQAALDKHIDYIKDSVGEHSRESYVPDGPGGDYAEAVNYDVLQLKQQ